MHEYWRLAIFNVKDLLCRGIVAAIIEAAPDIVKDLKERGEGHEPPSTRARTFTAIKILPE